MELKDLKYFGGFGYLASPYSHESRIVEAERARDVTIIFNKLRREGIFVYAPITCSHFAHTIETDVEGMSSGSWEEWEGIDKTFVRESNYLIVCTMIGWRESIGVTAEIEFAKALGKPIFYLDPHTMTLTKKEPAYSSAHVCWSCL